jgi:multidrug efflux system membrane fusion protein
MKRLTAGDRLAVDAFDRGGKTLLASGTLLTVDNQIDSATGTIKLKAEFPNDDYGLFPNQFVNARLLLETRRAAVLIPSTALLRGASTLPHGGSFVYVVNPDNTVSVRPVRPGATEGEMTAIEDGLAAGEVVVTDGTDRLREGAKIQVAGRDAVGEQGAAGPASPRARESAASPPAGSEREQGESRGTTDNPPSRQP